MVKQPLLGPSVRECTWAGTPIDGMTVERRSLPAMRPDELERRLRQRLDALGPAPRAEMHHVLMLPDFDRADRIGELWGHPESRTFRGVADRPGGGQGGASCGVRVVGRDGAEVVSATRHRGWRDLLTTSLNAPSERRD
jgi:hypothetical protein